MILGGIGSRLQNFARFQKYSKVSMRMVPIRHSITPINARSEGIIMLVFSTLLKICNRYGLQVGFEYRLILGMFYH